MNKQQPITRGIVNCWVGGLRNFRTFNQTKLTVDKRARRKSATNHTADRCATFKITKHEHSN